jgi:hypothetical protein
MISNREQHYQVYEDELPIDEWDIEEDEKEERKRLVGYIGGIIVFFYILFKYLI